MDYQLKEYIVYGATRIGEFGVQAYDIKTDQLLLFKIDDLVLVPNWKHEINGQDKNVHKAIRFENLESKLTNFNNLD